MKQNKEIEQEASLFACLLLMPKDFIKADLEEGLDFCDDTKLKQMAKKYEVPLTALLFRISYFLKYNT